MDVNINFDMSKASRRRIDVQPSLSKLLLKSITVTLFQCLHHKAFQCNPKPWPASTAVHGFMSAGKKLFTAESTVLSKLYNLYARKLLSSFAPNVSFVKCTR